MRKRSLGVRFCVLLAIAAVILLSVGLQAQETTGGLQGVVKDAGGAVVPKALVELTGTSLVGSKSIQTDGTGFYHFTNLPPGVYSVQVKAQGFATLKRDGVTLEVGHLPTLDLALKVGAAETVVEVSAEAPLIDLTTTHTTTNITEDEIKEVPHGRSFQSVIQFAPSARQEPLAGGSFNANSGVTASVGGNGSGNTSPGNGGNGGQFGFSVAGGADSENAYLVEGQETANLIGGYSHTNVPFEFIQEVQIKSSGVEAEHGGALGGVVNVIMKHGSNDWHGQIGASFESAGMDGSPNNYTRLNPQETTLTNAATAGFGGFDPTAQFYQPKKDGLNDFQPSITVGGPIWKDRIFGFLGFAPERVLQTRTVNFNAPANDLGLEHFDRNTWTYYSNGRIDARVGSKLNIFGSWLYQLARQTGELMPRADSTSGLYNGDTQDPILAFSKAFGSTAPDTTVNIGADFTITPQLVSTTRFGYFFENYHDFGFPTTGTVDVWAASGTAAKTCLATDTSSNGCSGVALPASLLFNPPYETAALNQAYTIKNADKHVQLDEDLAWFKSGRWGTHNVKGGYQLNRLSNDIWQQYNLPTVDIYPGQFYHAYTAPAAAGTYGYAVVVDFGTKGVATSYNHAFFVQDAWTLGKGVTVNYGIRFEHENVPAETYGLAAGLPTNPIEFGWGSKIGPRVGIAWDVFKNGKAKLFGSYGVFNDEMKLNVAISSFGGQWWNNCAYLLNDPNPADIVAAPDANRRYCNGNYNVPASLTATGASASNTFVENINYRGTEGATPGLKPYRQHESVVGGDYQLSKNVAFEARWDRRRIDHVIEDAALFAQGQEVFTIVNPGEGQNSTNATCLPPACPANVKPNRNYDGIELRLTKAVNHNWFGLVSYTYSKFRGNYAGLTSTDIADGGGGRNSPNNSRAFDETYFEYNAYGKAFNGLLATDRPNTFKGNAYYQMPWAGKRATTSIGWSQFLYQGSPLSSYIDVGGWQQPNFGPVYVEGRGKWADVSQDPTTSELTVNSVGVRRTPWYIQSDANFIQEFKPFKNNERQTIHFEATIANLLNQHSAIAYGSQIDSAYNTNPLAPGGLVLGQPGFYQAAENPYPWQTMLNTNAIGGVAAPVTLNSTYGKPIGYQTSRTIRLTFRYTF